MAKGATAQATRTNRLTSDVQITVRDVQMSGPSIDAIRQACNQVLSTGSSTGGTGGTEGSDTPQTTPQTTGQRKRRPMSAEARARIAAAARKRAALQKKNAGQATSSTGSKGKALAAGQGNQGST